MDGFLPLAEAPDRAPFAPEPGSVAGSVAAPAARSLWSRLHAWRPFLAVVIAPTLLAAIYVGLIAAPQYQSEAHFIVRTAAPTGGAPSGLGALLGLGAAGSGQGETRSVEDYLVSHDAVAALQRTIDVAAVFRRPEADAFSRLGGGPRPAPETVLKYYRRHVRVTSAQDTGIAVLTVRAFRPQDAQAIAETLLKLGEARVNIFNQRALVDGLSLARGQLGEAEAAVARSEGSVTSFRQARTDIDPERSSAAAISLSSTLEGQLAVERARLGGMGAIAADSPQRVAQQARVSALAAQVGAARGRLAGPRAAMAPTLGAYESLRLRQEFAAKRYEAAAAALETARTEALRQQLYVVRVVEPNLPVKALYPERLKTIGTLLLLLLMAYGIGWLGVAGVREHAA